LERCWRGGVAGHWSAGGARVRAGSIWVSGPDLGPIWTYGFGAGSPRVAVSWCRALVASAGRWLRLACAAAYQHGDRG
jgi:hypothetical protein